MEQVELLNFPDSEKTKGLIRLHGCAGRSAPLLFTCNIVRFSGVKAHKINRGSYTSAHVLLNLLNQLRKRDKMRGLPSILSFFSNEF